MPTDINMYYEQMGSGPDVVLISGMTADHTAWMLVTESLAQTHRVTVFDNRGAGRTDQPKQSYHIEQMADDTIKLMDTLEISSAIIAGHSMGGMIVQALAAKHPDRVKRAIIVCSLPYANSINRYVLSNGIKLRHPNVPQELGCHNTLPWLFSEAFLGQPEKVEFIINMMLDNPNPQRIEGYQGQLDAIVNFDGRPLHSHIKCPTTVISGGSDLLTSPQQSIEIANNIDGAEYIEAEGMGHMVPQERPEVVVNAIRG